MAKRKRSRRLYVTGEELTSRWETHVGAMINYGVLCEQMKSIAMKYIQTLQDYHMQVCLLV